MESRERSSTFAGFVPTSRPWAPFSSNNGMSNGPPQSSGSSVRSLRKRHSFFGRSNSDTSRTRRLNGSTSSTCSQDHQHESGASRPPTVHSTDSRRTTTEAFASIRNSLFSSRKNVQSPEPMERPESSRSRPSSRNGGQFASAVPNWSREHFQSREDYDRYLTKRSISPPFNFQHVTHTDRTRLPQLETVHEKDLSAEFWSEAAYQRPRRHLNGIKAEDLERRHQRMGITRGSPSSRPTTPVSPITEELQRNRPVTLDTIESVSVLDETMFDEVEETRFSPDDERRKLEPALEPAKQVVKYPKRFSSLNALNEMLQIREPIPEQATTFYESNSSTPSEEAEIQMTSQTPTQGLPGSSATSDANLIMSTESSEEDIAYRAKQPLPPLPTQTLKKKPSTNSLTSQFPTPPSNLSLVIPVQAPSSPESKSPTRSSQSTPKSLPLSSSNDTMRSASLSDATWEDDVDFCYEQAAESTCDFNWDVLSTPHMPLPKSEDSLSALESIYHAYSPISNESGGSFRLNGSSETIAERRRSRAAFVAGHHKRGSSSVGHRGFLAARKSSSDLVTMANVTPAQLDIAPISTPVSVLSPVLSITGAEEQPQKMLLPTGTLQFTRFDTSNTVDLSDPESCRNSNSSKHRKSSSYGSHESAARPMPHASAAKDANRWSVASASSVPELMHSRPPKSKLFLSKTIISAPLETLPQSPPMAPEIQIEESTIVPRELQAGPVRSSFLVRQGQSHYDRARLEAAGKGVQRRVRPTVPNRSSQLILTPSTEEPLWI